MEQESSSLRPRRTAKGTDTTSTGALIGTVVQQRSWLRRNLVNRIFRLGNAIQQQTQMLLAETSDISVVHFRILLRLSQAGPQNVQGIAELLGANRSLVSRALPTLRDKGWIHIEHHAQDKRQQIIHLSPKGQEMLAENRPLIDSRYEALTSAFSADEFEVLLDFLDRLDAVTARDPRFFKSEISEIDEDTHVERP